MSKSKFFQATMPPAKKFRKLNQDQISSIIANIYDQFLNNEEFLILLRGRAKDFENALENAPKGSFEHARILKQYQNFAIALEDCFLEPDAEKIQTRIEIYQERGTDPYFAVGALDPVLPLPFFEEYKSLFIGLAGALLVTAGAVTCAFGPLAVGIAALAFGAIALAISLFIYLSPPVQEANNIKAQEVTLFTKALELYENYRSADDHLANKDHHLKYA